MPIIRMLQEQGFNPEQTTRLGSAFDLAWQILITRDPDLKSGPLTTVARELLAKVVIEEAQKGVTEEADLVEMALTRFGEAGGPLDQK